MKLIKLDETKQFRKGKLVSTTVRRSFEEQKSEPTSNLMYVFGIIAFIAIMVIGLAIC